MNQPHTDTLSEGLRGKGLACRRGQRLLFRDVDFELRGGTLLHLAGPNGQGKSTLIKTLCGLRRPEKGVVTWCGSDVHVESERFTASLLYLGHENALNLDLTPLENLQFLQALQGEPTDGLESALEEAGLQGRLHLQCRRLSAGQRRRVALARLLLSTRSCWLLDEPAAALDRAGRGWLAEVLKKHADAGGMALFSAHESILEEPVAALHLA